MGWAWTYLVVASWSAANSGLGYAILKAQRFLQTDKIFAGIIIIGLIGPSPTSCFLGAPDRVSMDASETVSARGKDFRAQVGKVSASRRAKSSLEGH